jgi:hypothetical protein
MENKKQVNIDTRINHAAAIRLVNMFGPQILQAFLALEKQLITEKGGQDFFNQIGFINPNDKLKEGDLIPTVHLSLQPFRPVLSQPVYIDEPTDGPESAVD